MLKPGDVVTVEFPGAQGIKRRPAVVVSSDVYHNTRPDVILGLLTTNTSASTMPTDYVLQAWQAAGLKSPSAFRSFLTTVPVTNVNVVGHLSDRDWQQVQSRLNTAIVMR